MLGGSVCIADCHWTKLESYTKEWKYKTRKNDCLVRCTKYTDRAATKVTAKRTVGGGGEGKIGERVRRT